MGSKTSEALATWPRQADSDSDDMARWRQIAIAAHERTPERSSSLYVRAMSSVETSAHRYVADRTATARRVLEVGVGGGEHIAFAGDPSRHERYVGMDLDQGFARICTDRHHVPVAVADAEALPFPSASFDAVIALAILEHVERLSTALREVERVLEPGGILYAMIPTNGSFAVEAFKQAVSYPTMRRAGIKRPDLVWAALNVNNFKRVSAALRQRFDVTAEQGLPIGWLPWQLSPLWVFECRKRQ